VGLRGDRLARARANLVAEANRYSEDSNT